MTQQFVTSVSTTEHSCLYNGFRDFIWIFSTRSVKRVGPKKWHEFWMKIREGGKVLGRIPEFCLPVTDDGWFDESLASIFWRRILQCLERVGEVVEDTEGSNFDKPRFWGRAVVLLVATTFSPKFPGIELCQRNPLGYSWTNLAEVAMVVQD